MNAGFQIAGYATTTGYDLDSKSGEQKKEGDITPSLAN